MSGCVDDWLSKMQHIICVFLGVIVFSSKTIFMAITNLDKQPGRGNESRSNESSSGNRDTTQNQEDINVSNPQRGSEWSNYQTKELSTNEKSGISAEEAAQTFEEEDDE